MHYVQVAVNVPQLHGVFDYHLPVELEGQVQPGCLVTVPFGRQTVQGIVLRPVEIPAVPDTKPVAALLDPLPAVTPQQMKLAAWLSHEYLAGLSDCLHLMLPPGLSQAADTLYQLAKPGQPPPPDLANLHLRLLRLLEERGALRGRQIDAAVPRVDWRAAAQTLVRRGLVFTQPVLPPPTVHPKVVRTAQIALPPEQAMALVETISLAQSVRSRCRSVIQFLASEAMPVNAAWVYAQTGGKPEDLRRLAEAGLIRLSESEVWRDPLANLDWVPAEPPTLTHDQTVVWEELLPHLHTGAQGQTEPPLLLHGVTGSGKTEIYLRAVEETLRQGRQTILLVPEISLTPQTVRRFYNRFPGQVGLVHSRLSPGERYDTWRRARSGQLPVIVGPRSALFTPLPDIGLIVVDECHDESYYQDDFQPHYHAIQAAIAYAQFCGAAILLGSATPDVTLQYQARRHNWPVLRLPERILAHRQAVQAQLERFGQAAPTLPAEGEAAALPLPPVQVVDMRQELKDGNRSMFSRALEQALDDTLRHGLQSILFLNRRGTATYVFCRTCGASLRCPRCDIPLTFHSSAEALICHRCGYQRKFPARCPACGSNQIRQFGTGTEGVEAAVRERFPQARVLRWDSETARSAGAEEILLAHFTQHRADILVGTQLLAKGLDLPLVTLVGVVLADVGLNLPDYRAGERTFQLLTQVAGRAGRSPLGGQVLLQTYQPEHYAIRFAAGHDLEGFTRQELAYRREIGYPPYSRLVLIEIEDEQAEKAQARAQKLAEQIDRWTTEQGSNIERIGPAPCFFARRGGMFRWQIVLRGADPAALLRGRELDGASVSVDPLSLL